MLNRNPRLYLTLGGVIAKGTPNNTSTTVVNGNANLLCSSILNIDLICGSCFLCRLLSMYFHKAMTLYCVASSSVSTSFASIPKSTTDCPNQVVFNIFSSLFIV